MSDLTPLSSLSSLEYAPAPESRAVVTVQDAYGHFINGDFTNPASSEQFATINPATGEHLATVAQGSDADVDAAVAAARKAYEKVWSTLPGSERAKYLFRIARLIQERSRELAVLETLDNGKPIRETRDIDVPMAAAWFFYYAGWADKLDYAGFGPQPAALGVAGQVIPWNFPPPHGRVEDRAGTGRGQHGCSEARRNHSSYSPPPRRHHSPSGCAGRCGQHRDR